MGLSRRQRRNAALKRAKAAKDIPLYLKPIRKKKIPPQPKPELKKNKLTLATASKDYEGAIGLPENVTQREFESTGQFFRRIDRLIAKAKVEASMESRFDIELNQKHKVSDTSKGNGDTTEDER